MLTFGAKAQMPVLTEIFEGTAIPTGWTTIDADNDGHGWENNSLQNDLPSGQPVRVRLFRILLTMHQD